MFGTPTISDGMAMGTEGMKYSLISREVIADCVETCVQGQWMDGVLDVTIVYPQGRPSVVDLLTGRIQTIRVDLRVLAIPAALVDGVDEHVFGRGSCRERVCQ